jgi:hypothetical protein
MREVMREMGDRLVRVAGVGAAAQPRIVEGEGAGRGWRRSKGALVAAGGSSGLHLRPSHVQCVHMRRGHEVEVMGVNMRCEHEAHVTGVNMRRMSQV